MKKPQSKTELARFYGVSYPTFTKWLKDVPNLHLTKGQRILTPMQIKLILGQLGEP